MFSLCVPYYVAMLCPCVPYYVAMLCPRVPYYDAVRLTEHIACASCCGKLDSHFHFVGFSGFSSRSTKALDTTVFSESCDENITSIKNQRA